MTDGDNYTDEMSMIDYMLIFLRYRTLKKWPNKSLKFKFPDIVIQLVLI